MHVNNLMDIIVLSCIHWLVVGLVYIVCSILLLFNCLNNLAYWLQYLNKLTYLLTYPLPLSPKPLLLKCYIWMLNYTFGFCLTRLLFYIYSGWGRVASGEPSWLLQQVSSRSDVLPPNQQCQPTEGIKCYNKTNYIIICKLVFTPSV